MKTFNFIKINLIKFKHFFTQQFTLKHILKQFIVIYSYEYILISEFIKFNSETWCPDFVLDIQCKIYVTISLLSRVVSR